MKDKKSGESRRKLLKSIAAGSGAIVAGKSLPESWSRPVVDSVMLPAHAQTSPPPSACTTEFAGTYEGNATGTITRCNDVTEDHNPPLTIIIGADCSVSVSITGNRPFTGTGTITGSTFSVAVSRPEDCAAPTSGNGGSGTVSGTVSGTQISGNASLSGPCVCSATVLPTYLSTTTYTIDKV